MHHDSDDDEQAAVSHHTTTMVVVRDAFILQQQQQEQAMAVLAMCDHFGVSSSPHALSLEALIIFYELLSATPTSTELMLQKINEYKKGRVTRSNFAEPKFKTVLYQYSFLSIPVRLLNSFIFKHLSDNEKTFRSAFQSSILLLFNGNKKFWNKD